MHTVLKKVRFCLAVRRGYWMLVKPGTISAPTLQSYMNIYVYGCTREVLLGTEICKRLGSWKSSLSCVASVIWGQPAVFSCPEFPQGALLGNGCSWWPDGGHPVSTLKFLLGSPSGVAVMWWLDDCDILCLLIWQVTFLIKKDIHVYMLSCSVMSSSLQPFGL